MNTPDPVATQRQRLADLIDRRREVQAIVDGGKARARALDAIETRLTLADESLAAARHHALDGDVAAAKRQMEQADAKLQSAATMLQELGAWEMEPA